MVFFWQLSFGLAPGDQLPLETTFCNEIRQHKQTIVFASASEHPTFSLHPTPKLYKFESYSSVPIFRGNGDFFGTLSAIQPGSAREPEEPYVVKTLRLLARLIAV